MSTDVDVAAPTGATGSVEHQGVPPDLLESHLDATRRELATHVPAEALDDVLDYCAKRYPPGFDELQTLRTAIRMCMGGHVEQVVQISRCPREIIQKMHELSAALPGLCGVWAIGGVDELALREVRKACRRHLSRWCRGARPTRIVELCSRHVTAIRGERGDYKIALDPIAIVLALHGDKAWNLTDS